MAGKGSKPRPIEIDRKTFEDNWDRIFSSNKKIANRDLFNQIDKQKSMTDLNWDGDDKPVIEE